MQFMHSSLLITARKPDVLHFSLTSSPACQRSSPRMLQQAVITLHPSRTVGKAARHAISANRAKHRACLKGIISIRQFSLN